MRAIGFAPSFAMTPQYRQSFLAALAGHFVLLVTAVVVSVLPGCRRHTPVDLSTFDNIDIRNIDTTKPLQRNKPAPAHPVPIPPPPTDIHEPIMPDDPVQPRPPPVVDRPPVVVKPPDTAPDGALRDRTPRDKPKPVASNFTAGVATGVPVVRSTVRTTRLASTGGPRRPLVIPKLTAGELDPLGGRDAPLGNSNSIPMEERTRCLLLIKRALYDAWDQPALADAGPQPAEIEIRFDLGGRIVGASIVRSSGSDVVDRSALTAARTTPRVEGLTQNFLKDSPRVTVEFKVTE
jgi:TonB family protein